MPAMPGRNASSVSWLGPGTLRGIFRRTAIAGQCFAEPDDIDHATRIATAQLNTRAKPWV
jgi:hypothetical protein